MSDEIANLEPSEALEEPIEAPSAEPPSVDPLEEARRVLIQHEAQKDEAFMSEYRALCERYGRRIVVDAQLFVERTGEG